MTKRLTIVWAALMALTLGSMAISHPTGHDALPRGMVALVLVLAVFKAGLLLEHYLELRHAPAWNNALRGMVILLLGIVFLLSLLG